MPGRVVDASVVAAWCFREPRASEALSMLDGVDLYAPVLLAYELTNVALRKIIQRGEHAAAVQASLEIGLELPIRWRNVPHLAVLRLATETGLTTYDASYLHLARTLGLPLVTFDARLNDAADHHTR